MSEFSDRLKEQETTAKAYRDLRARAGFRCRCFDFISGNPGFDACDSVLFGGECESVTARANFNTKNYTGDWKWMTSANRIA